MTNTKLEAPAPLDTTKLITRQQYKDWQNANHDYQAALQEEQERAAKQAEAKAAAANRLLSDDEYDAAAARREADRQARQAERDAAEKAEQERKAAYLASMPDVAEISATNPYSFTLQVIHWAGLGYTLPDGGDVTALPTYYAAQLVKPAAPAAKKTK